MSMPSEPSPESTLEGTLASAASIPTPPQVPVACSCGNIFPVPAFHDAAVLLIDCPACRRTTQITYGIISCSGPSKTAEYPPTNNA